MFEPWQLKDFEVGGGLAACAEQGGDAEGWIAATVPGDTHRALVRAGRLADPFRDRNEAGAAWVAEREWWWRTRFEAPPAQPGERVELVFEGLDTFARIYLNGELLGGTDNMFREWRFEIGARLRAGGGNTLAIAFAPATASVIDQPPLVWAMSAEKITASRRNQIRKAQYGWGWDWGPNLPGVGVWQPVRIERQQLARIADLRFRTVALADDRAELLIELGIERLDAGTPALQAQIRLRDPEGGLVVEQTVAAEGPMRLALSVAQPRLWWTADLGAQPLYTVEATLLAEGGQALDAQSRRVGIRTLQLDTSDDPDEPGCQFFRFVLNGVPIFARGACWIPAHSFVGELGEAHYRPLLEQAVQGQMNMLRVWGGGIYEPDCFYELCDALGLLVWQDFMFACAPYADDDPAFVDNVMAELGHQVRRLRHHPSLALWCGNNENQVIQTLINTMTGTEAALAGARYYDELMPALLTELDPVTPYWPGSPWGGANPNSMRAGDVHDWTVWHGFPPVPDADFVGTLDRSPEGVAYTRYAEDLGRFISEFGIHAAPAMDTLKRWLAPEDLHLDSPGFLDRIKDHPKDKVNAMLIPVTGLPATLEQYIAYTQLVQAEGLKFGIEHFRRRKPHCSGTLIWQYNDCWPCVSWSLVDYDGVGKAGYYAVARAYAPVMASFKLIGEDQAELWITNDSLLPIDDHANVQLQRLAGGADWAESLAYAVPANSSRVVWRGPVPAGAKDRVLCVQSAGGCFPDNRLLLAPVKELALVAGAAPTVRIERLSPQELCVHLGSAEAYLLCVSLGVDTVGTRFSDNHFDLRAGESRSIRVSHPSRVLAADDLSVRCWNSLRR